MCRDGCIRTVAKVDSFAAWLNTFEIDGACVFRSDGKGTHSGDEKRYDVLAAAPEIAEEKPKLTLPLTEGQRVLCRDGEIRTVANVRGDYADYVDDSRTVWASLGRCSKMEGPRNHFDAVADAE